MEGIKKLMLKNQLLSQALIFFFMLFLTTFLFSLILKLVLPFLNCLSTNKVVLQMVRWRGKPNRND